MRERTVPGKVAVCFDDSEGASGCKGLARELYAFGYRLNSVAGQKQKRHVGANHVVVCGFAAAAQNGLRDACVFFRQAAFDVFFGVLCRDAEIGRRKTTGLNVAVFIQSGIFRRTGNGNFVVTAAVYDKTAFHAEFFERLCDRFDQSRVVNADDGIVASSAGRGC